MAHITLNHYYQYTHSTHTVKQYTYIVYTHSFTRELQNFKRAKYNKV